MLILKQIFSATPLRLLNRISWNLVGNKDTICKNNMSPHQSGGRHNKLGLRIGGIYNFSENNNQLIQWTFPTFTRKHWMAVEMRFCSSVEYRRTCLNDSESHLKSFYRKLWSPEFYGSYAPLNLEISRNYYWSSLSAQLLWDYWTEFHETW
jgi:hypothetical protein